MMLITPTCISPMESWLSVDPSSRCHKEYCLLETSSNSIRMSLRMKFEGADPIDRIIGRKYITHFTSHADDYCILRRKSLEVSVWYCMIMYHLLYVNNT